MSETIPEDQVASIIREADKMARRLGYRFVPSPTKIAAFRAAIRNPMEGRG